MTTGAVARSFTILRGLVYSAGFVGVWLWLAGSVRRFDADLPIAIPGWLAPIGVVVAVVGGIVAAACIATFVTIGRGTPAPFDPPREFVASGPYRYVRNPMYVGAALALFGGGLALASPAVLALAIAFLALMHGFVVLYEEPTLADTFDGSYLAYKASVRRWRPRRPSSARAAG
ncbi:MAG TPA: methyltransferase [Candidatus Binatia bacterium]|nr:methyltransferase [Candidatus Binatia bacterium]